MAFQIFKILYVLLTGAIVISLSTFLAAGGIGENFTENPYPYSWWLWLILIWGVGALLSFNVRLVRLGLFICTLPILFFIYRYFF